MNRSLSKRQTWLSVLLIWLFFFLALDSAVDDSPTMDEQNHLARGLAFLRTGDPRLSMEHPPLVNLLSALPLLTMPEITLPLDHPSWDRPEGWYEFADLLLWHSSQDVTKMVFLARLPVIFLTLGMALLAYRFARQLWGRRSALLALFLILFDPNILAHGRYITTDVGGTAFLFLSFFLLWQMWRKGSWSWRRWLLAGVGMGLAFGSKLSSLGFVPVMAFMAILPIFDHAGASSRWKDAARRLVQFVTAGLLSIIVLWAIFGFQWEPFQFRNQGMSWLNEMSGPMPTYWAGVEQIAAFTGIGRGSAFLLGKFSDHGFPAYFPVAFAAKTPLATQLLLLIAVIILLADRQSRSKAAFLLLPAAMFFGLSVTSALNIGYRHLLPMLPFLMVLISGLVRASPVDATRHQTRMKLKWNSAAGFTFSVLLLSLLISDLLVHPSYLSYFNVAAGGPQNGRNLLVDSNIDWGQDLIRLGRWMDRNGVNEVNLGWFGSADPGHYGIDYQPLPGLGRAEFFHLWWNVPFDRTDPEPGWYAISVSALWELPLRPEEKTVYAWFRQREPDDQIGYSILLYQVP